VNQARIAVANTQACRVIDSRADSQFLLSAASDWSEQFYSLMEYLILDWRNRGTFMLREQLLSRPGLLAPGVVAAWIGEGFHNDNRGWA
jgi:hypothetical protein